MNHRILKNNQDRYTAYVGVNPDHPALNLLYELSEASIKGVEITFIQSGEIIALGQEMRRKNGIQGREWNLTDEEKKLTWIGWFYPDDTVLEQVKGDVEGVVGWLKENGTKINQPKL